MVAMELLRHGRGSKNNCAESYIGRGGVLRLGRPVRFHGLQLAMIRFREASVRVGEVRKIEERVGESLLVIVIYRSTISIMLNL